ncbi:MAG: transcriptional regulator, LysR family [Firmicutes bacterium]|nr:transcriptional regulator, LysR family [Bacillota bacterium]
MELHQLIYFKTVANLEHVSKAAEVLAISQPALSRSIAKLEEELGVPLFERQGKRIILNRYGRYFLKNVDRALQEIIEGRQALFDLQDANRGTIALAFLHSLGTHFVPALLGKFRKKYPDIQFNLYQNSTNFILNQLESGEIDLCFSSPSVTKKGIEWTPLFKEPLYVIVPKEHKLFQREQIHLKEIEDEPIITLKRDYGLRILTDQYFEAVGIKPRIVFEGEEISTVAGLVEANLGVALIPKILGYKANISFLPVSEPTCERTIGIAWMEGRYMPPVSKKFKDFVIRSFS